MEIALAASMVCYTALNSLHLAWARTLGSEAWSRRNQEMVGNRKEPTSDCEDDDELP